MKELQLTQGKTVLLDDKDFKRFGNKKWFVQKVYDKFYATRKDITDGKAKVTYLHRLVAGAKKDARVSFINGNSLDCTFNNLKVATFSERYDKSDKSWVKLATGEKVMIDEEDWEQVIKYNWCKSAGYASTRLIMNGKKTVILMHRLILGLVEGDGRQVDHIDHNVLNNKKENLRLCTTSQNAANKISVGVPKTSKYKGVSWNRRDERWAAAIQVEKKGYSLGRYDTDNLANLAVEPTVTASGDDKVTAKLRAVVVSERGTEQCCCA